jgi:ribosomal protein S18 acetylase RimI-like enzyme
MKIVRFAERDELDAIAALQSDAFYEPLAPALGTTVFDAPVRAYFEYDVRQTLERKYFPYAAQGRFAPLVIDAGESDVVGVVEISVQRDFECMRALEDVEGLSKTHEYAYLSCMAVDASARRRGFATALIAGGEVIAREWGFNILTLHVFAENADALRVYERAGYTVLDRPFRTPLDVVKNRSKLYMAKRL